MTIISLDHKNKIQFVRNHLPCRWILKMIHLNKYFNPPDQVVICLDKMPLKKSVIFPQ